MLSLTALAALPMAGFANATWSVPADKNSVKDWTAAENTKLDSSVEDYLVGFGAGISQEITLVKGTYTVTVDAKKTSNATFTILVGGKSYNPGDVFTLEAETNTVTLKVDRISPDNIFTVGGINVSLIFDFAKTKSNLTSRLNDVKDDLALVTSTWGETLQAKATSIEGIIGVLQDGTLANGTESDAYKAYKEQQLYNYGNSETPSKIEKDIQTLEDCFEVLTAFDGMDKALSDLKLQLEGASDAVKAQYKGTVDGLEKEIGNFKKDFAYTGDNITVNKQEWLDKISYKSEDGVESGYRVTISTLSEDLSAYDAVISKFNAASTAYDGYLTELEQSIAGEEYATLLDKAKKALQAAYSAVVTLKDGFPQLGFSKKQDALISGVDNAILAMQGVKDAFVDHGNDMKRYFNEVQSDFSTLAECQAQIKANQWNISTQAAEDATQAVKNALEAVMAGATKDALGAFPTNYDELKSAAHTAVSNLKTLVDNDASTDYLTGLRSAAHAAYKAAKGEVAEYKTEDGKYVAASFWGLAEAAIEAELGELDNISIDPTAEGYNPEKIANAIKAVYVKDGEGETATESGSVATYKSKAKAAYDKYVAMKAVIDSWNDEYDKVAEFISTTSLVPYNTTTYGAALVEAKKEIENLESGLKTAVETQNTEDDLYAHANAMNVLKVPDSKDMPEILSVDAETYNAAKDAHDLTTAIATANKLAVEVPAMAKALRNELGNRYNQYKPSDANIAIYGKHLEEKIFGPGLDAGVAKEDNFCGIRQAFYDVKHVISETESWGVNPDGTYTARALPENPSLKEAQEYIIDLGNDRSAFTKISERIAGLDKAAEKVAEDFKANNNAYDTFIKNYNEAVKTAGGIKDVNNYVDTNREKEFEGYYTTVETLLTDLKTALDKSKNAETFVADREDADGKKGFYSQLKDINTAISDYLTKATNAKENLSAYNSLIEAKKALYDATNTSNPITEAVRNDILSNFEDNAGRQYYINYLEGLKQEIEALVLSIENYYTNGVAQDKETATKNNIKEIVAKVNAVKTNCADNEKNYTDLVACGKKVEELYIKIYNKIDTKDQTDDKQTYLKRLAVIDTDLQTAKKAIETAFGEGKLSNDTKTSQYQTYVKDYNTQTTDINAVYGDWIDKDNGYLASVATANGEALATITDAYNAAVNDCIDYINKLKKFFDVDGDANRWNDIVATATADLYDAKNKLEEQYEFAKAEKEAIDKANTELDNETVENAKYFDNASTYYKKVTDEEGNITSESGTIYDAHTAIKNAYNTAVGELNKSAKSTLSSRILAVKDKIQRIADQEKPVGSKIYSICFDENGDFSTDLLKPYFSEVNNKLASAKLWLDDKELALNYMNKYDSDLKTLETETLPAALDELAKAQYEAWVAELDKLYKELYGNKATGTEGLFTMCAKDANLEYKNGKTYKETFDAAYEEWQSYVEGYTPKYEDSTEEGAVNMSDVAQKFSNFKSNSGYTDFKNQVSNFEQSKVYYEMFMTGAGLPEGSTKTSVEAVQEIIDGYSDYASEFIAKASAVTEVQGMLDTAKSKAEEYHSSCSMNKWNYQTLYDNDLSSAKDAADNLKVTINEEEYNTLLTQLTYLKSDYQQALTEENLTEEAKEALQKEYEPKILEFETRLTFKDEDLADTEWDAEGVETPTHTCNKLLDIQNEIIKARNTLSAGRMTGVYNAFMESLGSLKKRYDVMAADHEGLYDFMKAGISLEADKTAELKESVKTFKANGWLIVQESNLKSQIDDWKDTLKDLEDDVAAAKKKHDADVAARERLTKELEGIKKHVEDLLNNELFQQFKVKDAWSDWGYEDWFNGDNGFIPSNEADINSVPTTEGELKDQDPDNPTQLKDIRNYKSIITDFEGSSYYNEVWNRYNPNATEYTTVGTTLKNIANLLNDNQYILNAETHSAKCDELIQQASAAYNFIYNLYLNYIRSGKYYTTTKITGEEIKDEAGNTVGEYHDHETFVGEDVPAAIRIFERILTDAEKLKSDIQKDTYKPGNIDQDENGNVSLSDFAMLQYIILGHEEGVTEVQKAAADLNNDDRVDISDLMKLVQMILNPNAAPAPARVRVAIPHATTDDALSIIVEGEGVHQRIGILLDAEQTYAGCQMDITLPEGVTLAAETTGEMAGALSLLSNDLENGSHRILLSSAEGAGMNTGKGALLWLDVNVDHNYNGEGIVLSNVLFANSYGRAFELAIAAGETTGLSNVSMTQEVKEKIYNVGGILMDGLKRGVNIIRGNDGSSKKVIVK